MPLQLAARAFCVIVTFMCVYGFNNCRRCRHRHNRQIDPSMINIIWYTPGHLTKVLLFGFLVVFGIVQYRHHHHYQLDYIRPFDLFVVPFVSSSLLMIVHHHIYISLYKIVCRLLFYLCRAVAALFLRLPFFFSRLEITVIQSFWRIFIVLIIFGCSQHIILNSSSIITYRDGKWNDECVFGVHVMFWSTNVFYQYIWNILAFFSSLTKTKTNCLPLPNVQLGRTPSTVVLFADTYKKHDHTDCLTSKCNSSWISLQIDL